MWDPCNKLLVSGGSSIPLHTALWRLAALCAFYKVCTLHFVLSTVHFARCTLCRTLFSVQYAVGYSLGSWPQELNGCCGSIISSSGSGPSPSREQCCTVYSAWQHESAQSTVHDSMNQYGVQCIDSMKQYRAEMCNLVIGNHWFKGGSKSLNCPETVIKRLDGGKNRGSAADELLLCLRG